MPHATSHGMGFMGWHCMALGLVLWTAFGININVNSVDNLGIVLVLTKVP